MNKRGFSFVTYFILILVFVVLAMAQKGVDTQTIDKTIDTLNWTKTNNNISLSLQNSIDRADNEFAKSLLLIVQKAIDFAGYTIFEVTKLAMKTAKDHPDIINYKILLVLIVLSLLSPLIYPAFIIIVSVILIIKEAILVRREKKKLKEMRDAR